MFLDIFGSFGKLLCSSRLVFRWYSHSQIFFNVPEHFSLLLYISDLFLVGTVDLKPLIIISLRFYTLLGMFLKISVCFLKLSIVLCSFLNPFLYILSHSWLFLFVFEHFWIASKYLYPLLIIFGDHSGCY